MAEWAPVIGSTIVAIATLIALFFTVRENGKTLRVTAQHHQEALTHSENREWTQWRRQKLTEHCEAVLTTGQDVIGCLRGCVYWNLSDFHANFLEQSNRIAELSNIYRKMEFIVGESLDAAAAQNSRAIAGILEGVRVELSYKSRSEQQAYIPGEGLDRIEPACEIATAALREFARATRGLMGEPPGTAA